MKAFKNFYLYSSICLFLFAAAPYSVAQGRQRIRLDQGWRFHLGDVNSYQISGSPITQWIWKEDDSGAEDASTQAASTLDTSGWKTAAPNEDTFHGRIGYSWYRTALPKVQSSSPWVHFTSVDDVGTVYLNGMKLYFHSGWNEQFTVSLARVWNHAGPNILAVLVQNTDGPGGIGDATIGGVSRRGARGPALASYNDKSWRTVHLPHDFVIEGKFTPNGPMSHGFLPVGVGWYRKRFYLSPADEGKRIWLEFDGIYRDSRIWLNNHFLGRHRSGYTSFRYDATSSVHYGAWNTLSVRADARSFEGWWYEGGGIYRHVWLVKTSPLHITHWGVFVHPTLNSAMTRSIVHIDTSIMNRNPHREYYTLISRVLDKEGHQIVSSSSQAIQPYGDTITFKQQVFVNHPHLWSLDHPYLYTLISLVEQKGVIVDNRTTSFGVRTFRFDPQKGLFLNGKHVEIQGTCNHQDFIGVGIGMPDDLLTWRIEQLKKMGSNAYRCSHNPPAPALLDACDRLGMLVMDENRHLGDTYSDHSPSGVPYSNLSDLASMVRRDRNHPSIIIWSMCNEEGLQSTAEGVKIFTAMMKVVHKYDKTRPISCAMNGGWGTGFSNVEDLQGCNYNPGGYDAFHEAHPNMPMFGSEIGSTVSDRGVFQTDPQKGYVSGYDENHPGWAEGAEGTWGPIGRRPYFAGGFVWTGFDYKGEPTPYGWPCVNSHFGLMDMCGFPKPIYYHYQSWWTTKPMVHLLPHWNWPGKEGESIAVWAFSNCDQVELFLNGKSLGRQDMPQFGHLEWNVPYAPGKLAAKAYKNGKLAAEDVVETTGSPFAIRLLPDSSTVKADGEELIMVTVEIVDQKGRVVPTADNLVHFRISGSGEIAGVGNGDPSCHQPDQADYRSAFNGLCMVLVRGGEHAGKITLTASSGGLQSAICHLNSLHSAEK